MKKINLKIMSLAMVSLLGISCFGQLNASAMLRRSQGKSSAVVDVATLDAESKEELIRQLPNLWRKYRDAEAEAHAAIDRARDAAVEAYAAAGAVYDATDEAKVATYHARVAAYTAAHKAAFSCVKSVKVAQDEAEATVKAAAEDIAIDAAKAAADTALAARAAKAAARAYARADAADAAIDAGYKAYNAAYFAAYDGDGCTAVLNNAFANAWKPGGAAYTVVKDNEISYFRNLARVLVEQTQKTMERTQKLCTKLINEKK